MTQPTLAVQHHTVTTSGGHDLHVVTTGPDDAPPLLLLHCWTGNWEQWRRTLGVLGRHFRCIVPEHLGFGESDKPRRNLYQIDRQAARTLDVLRHFGIDRARVLGHSMGGQIALTLAGQQPDVVERLAVVAPSVTGRVHWRTWIGLPILALTRRGILWPHEMIIRMGPRAQPISLYLMKSMFYNPYALAREANYWSHRAIAQDQTFSAAWAQHSIFAWDTTPWLARITAPTLAVWGLDDYNVPVSEAEVLEMHIPDARVVRLAQCGHFPMIEAWEGYIAAVEGFLR